MRHLLLFFLGLTATLFAFFYAAFSYRLATNTLDTENIYKSEYHSNFDEQNKVLLIGTGCWVILSSAYLNSNTGEVAVGGYPARADGLINVLSRKHYDLDKTFYLYGWKPSGDLETHTVSIFRALQEKNVRALVYTNAPGGLQTFIELEANLGVAPVLEQIVEQYPQAAPFAATYLDALRKSVGYRLAKTKMAIETPRELCKSVAASLEPGRSFKGIFAAFDRPPTPPAAQQSRGNSATAYPPITPEAYEALLARHADDFDRVLETSLQTYGKDGSPSFPFRPMLPAKEFWSCSAGVFDVWLRMVLSMARQKNVAFVYYIPPHLQVEESQRDMFHENYTARVAKILSEFDNAVLVDHSNLPGFNSCDLAPIRRVETAPLRFRVIYWHTGYIFNLIGKIKTMRHLLAALGDAGVVKARRGSPKAPLPVEATLRCPPAQGRSYVYDFPEESMQPQIQTLSAPLDNSNYGDYLCKVVKLFTP